VIEGDVAALDLGVSFHGCDYVFHLAALPNVPRSIKDAPLSNRIPQPDTAKEFPEINAGDLVSGDELSVSDTAAFGHFGALFPRSFPEN
jgi:hypothetical protein